MAPKNKRPYRPAVIKWGDNPALREALLEYERQSYLNTGVRIKMVLGSPGDFKF